MEKFVVNNAYGYYENGEVDRSVRSGKRHGFTMTLTGQKSDPEDGAVINLNTAWRRMRPMRQIYRWVNALWHRFETRVISMRITKSKPSMLPQYHAVCEDDC